MSTPRMDRLDKNFLINGSLYYWQRNNNLSSGAELGGYNSVDRFAITTFNTSGTRVSAQQSADKPNELTKYSGLLSFTSSSTASFDISQKIEGVFARPLDSQSACFGMWYKTDEFNQIRIRVLRPTAEDNYASTVTIFDQTFSTTADSAWHQLVVTGIAMDSSMHLGCQVIISGAGRVNGSGSRFFRYAQLQLNIGASLPSFNHAGRDFVEEEVLCCRYYEKSYELDVTPGTNTEVGIRAASMMTDGDTGRFIFHSANFRVRKRIVPAVSFYAKTGTLNRFDQYNNNGTGPVVSTVAGNGTGSFGFYMQATTSGWANSDYEFHFTADAEIP